MQHHCFTVSSSEAHLPVKYWVKRSSVETECKVDTNKQNKCSICTVSRAVTQSHRPPAASFVTLRQNNHSPALVQASIKVTGGSLWSTDAWVNECPPTLFHPLLTQGRGFMVTDSDPELTSLCVATETEELRKREEAGRWRVTAHHSEGEEARSESFTSVWAAHLSVPHIWQSAVFPCFELLHKTICLFHFSCFYNVQTIRHTRLCSTQCTQNYNILIPVSTGSGKQNNATVHAM